MTGAVRQQVVDGPSTFQLIRRQLSPLIRYDSLKGVVSSGLGLAVMFATRPVEKRNSQCGIVQYHHPSKLS